MIKSKKFAKEELVKIDDEQALKKMSKKEIEQLYFEFCKTKDSKGTQIERLYNLININ